MLLRSAHTAITRRGVARLSTAPAPAVEAIRALYRRGSGRRKTGPGQPRVVACVTGGGGSLFSWLLSEPGASSCLLEGIVPYDKESLNEFLADHGRSADHVGFCSPEMAAELAAAARDRAIALTPLVAQWPDAIGVASTATIVSHFTRRGDYRVHAAACTGADASVLGLTHKFVKGARERPEEDTACAMLTLRALAEAAGLESAGALATCGVRTLDTAATNAVGESASGVEAIPTPQVSPPSPTMAAAPRVLIPRAEAYTTVPLPLNGALPRGTLIVANDDEWDPTAVAQAASAALSALGTEGDGGDGAWALPPAPVLFEAASAGSAAKLLSQIAPHATAAHVTNWAILSPPADPVATSGAAEDAAAATTSNEEAALMSELPPPHTHRALSGALPLGSRVLLSPASAHRLLASLLAHWQSGQGAARLAAASARGGRLVVARPMGASEAALEEEARSVVQTELPAALREAFVFCSEHWHDGALNGLSDGSPSTDGVDGVYTGGWDARDGRPQGRGEMKWENGITYEGHWTAGKYDGYGSKSYSRGGGYAGMWRHGLREGYGTSYFGGKWGHDRWVGPFVKDMAHGVGTMYPHVEGGASEEGVPFEFVHGKPKEE